MSIRGHGRLALLDDIGNLRKHRAAVLCAGFDDVAECKQLDLLSVFPEVPRNTACRARVMQIYPLRIDIDLEICSRVPRIFLAGR